MKKETLIPPIDVSLSRAPRASRRKLAGMRSRAQFSALEARTLYSADLGVTAALPGADGPQVASAEAVEVAGSSTLPAAYGRDTAITNKAVAATAERDVQADKLATDALFKLVNDVRNPAIAAPLEIVLIDSRVPDIDVIRQALQAEIDGGRNLAVMVVDSQTDGINRVSQMLSMAGQKVSALHIISHGESGEFTLGSTEIDSQTLETRSAELANWSRYLGADADVLIYGCDVAQDPSGEQFLSRFGELTGTDVAASKDLTGAKSLGGNWDLEYQSGQINRPTIASSDLQRTWQNVLPSSTSAEIAVNQTLAGDQINGQMGYFVDTNGVTTLSFNGNKSVSVNAAGDTAVAWSTTVSNIVSVRTFHPDGSAHSNEIVVFDPAAEGVAGPLAKGESSASVAMRPDGSFVVTWAVVQTTGADNIYAQRYTSEGLPLGPRIVVSGGSHSYMRTPEIDVDDSGGFVIAYGESEDTGVPAGTDPNWAVYVSGYNANGSVRFAHTLIDGGSYFSGAKDPSIAVAGDGSFVVVYERHWDLVAISGDDISAKQRNADGTANGGSFQINADSSTYTPIDPSVDASRDGAFVVTFDNMNTATGGHQVLVRQYSSAGSALAAEQVISPADGSINASPSVAVDPNDGSRFVIAWSKAATSTSAYNVVTQGYNGLAYQSGLYSVTSDTSYLNMTPSVASNGNLITIDYRSSNTPLASNNFDVMMVNHIDDTNAYLAIPPTVQAPNTQLMMEDGLLQFTLSAGNAIQIGDSDASGGLSVSLYLPTGDGTFTIADTSMITAPGGVAFGGPMTTNALNFQGTLSQVNTALAQLVFNPAANYNGTFNLIITATELYGPNPTQIVRPLAITVSAVNDAPQIFNSPGTLQAMPGRNVALSAANINMTDVDALTGYMTVEVVALHGTVTLSAGAPVTFTAIDRTAGANHERGLTMTGTLANINSALASLLTYTSDSSFTGADTIAVKGSDGGNTGTGGTLTAYATIGINVVADLAPVINGSSNTSSGVFDGTSSDLSTLFGLPALSIADPDAGTTNMRLTLNVDLGEFTSTAPANGILVFGSMTPLAMPLATNQVDVVGTLSDLNTFIAGLKFESPSNMNGNGTFTMQVDDQQGYAQSQTLTSRNVTVTWLNDAPTVSVGPMSTAPTEDVRTTLGTMFGTLSVADSDVGGNMVEVTVTASAGTLDLATLGKNLYNPADNSLLTLNLSGTSLSVRGTLSSINAALPQISYTGALNDNGAGYSVTLTVNDLGNNNGTAASGLTATQTRTFAISAVDDGPTLNFGNAAASVTEDTSILLSSLFSNLITVNDVDAGTSAMKLAVSVDSGDMSADLSGLGLVDASTGQSLSGTAIASQFQLLGSQAQLNVALQRIYYRPALNAVAPVALSLTIDDLGNTGIIDSGASSLAVTATRSLSVIAVDDSPVVNTGLLSGAFIEDTPRSLGSMLPSLSIADVDAGNGNLALTLTAGRGTLSLDTTGLGLLNATTGAPLSGLMVGTSINFKAPLATLNAILPQVMFAPDANANGTGFSFAVAVDDLGNTGLVTAGVGTASATRYFSVQAVNDAPVFQVGALSSSLVENTSTSLSAIFTNVLQVSDIDAGSGQMKLTVSTTMGSFALDSTGLALLNADTGAALGSPFGNSSLNILGSLSDLNIALQRIQFTPALNSTASAVISLNIDDQGNTGLQTGSGSGTDGVSALLNIAAVDNKPVVTMGPASLILTEDTPVTLGSLFPTMSISDVDAGNGNILVTLNASLATLSIDTTGLGLYDASSNTALQGTLQGTSISFKAPLATVNAVLPQILFTPALNANGSGFALEVFVDDLGNTGMVSAAGTSDSALSYLSAAAVNDAPVVHIGPQVNNIVEDVAVNLASLFASNLSISDVDAGTAKVDLNVTVSHGNMTLDLTGLSLFDPATGLSLVGNPSGSALHLQGSVSQLNAALQALQYQTAPNINTPVTLTLSVDDLGNSGSGTLSAQATDSRALNVSAVNDPPVAFIGIANGSILEDTPTTLGNLFAAISVSDVDAGSGNLQVTLTGTRGTLSLAVTGLGLEDATTGAPLSGNLSGATISYRGSLSAINASLPQVLFVPGVNSNGTGFAVTLAVDDLGNTGAQVVSPSMMSVSQSFAVTAVNDLARPNISATAIPVLEDTPTPLGAIFSTVAIVDVDSGSGLLLVTVSVNNGSLAFNSSGKNLFDASTGTTLSGPLSGSSMSFQGTKASLNAVLPNIIFTPPVNANGSAFTLTTTVDDQGNTGLAPVSTTPISLVRNFSVSAVNDAPAIDVQGLINGIEDTPLVFSVANNNLISISDPDGAVSVTVDLSVNHGLISLGNLAGLSFASGDGTSDGAMRFTATVAQINAALNGLTFAPDKDFAGDASLAINVNDNGNTGSGGALSAQATTLLRMAQVNDAPVILAASSVAQDAGAVTAFGASSLLVTDVESAADQITYTVTVVPSQGNLMLNGLALQAGSNFTQADINAGLLSYVSSPAAGGTDSVRLSVTDGSGSSPMPIALTVTVKAAPVFQSSSASSSSSGSASTGSANSGNIVSATSTAAGKATAVDPSVASSNAAAAAAAPAGAFGSGFGSSSGTDSSSTQKQAGSNAGVSTGLANAAPSAAGAAAIGAQGRSDAGRLPEAALASLAPIANTAPIAPAATASEPAKPVDSERPIFLTPGITLPAQGIPLEKMTGDNNFQREMERVREDVMQVATMDRGVMASTIGASASFTLGYILWLVRGGVLISSLLASLPAWRMVDPLPVLGSLGGSGKNKDDKSLEELVEHKDDVEKDVEKLEEEVA